MKPKRAAVVIGVSSLAALTSACSTAPHGPFMPVRYDPAPALYHYYSHPQRAYRSPQTYAVNNRGPVPLAPPRSWQDQLAPYAEGAAVGAVGGALAGRAMGARGIGGQVAKGALPGEARAIATQTEAAARAAVPVAAAARAGPGGASEALTAGRTVGAAGAGAAAVGAAGTAGGKAVIGRALIWTVRRSWIGLAVLTAGEFLLNEGKPDDR